MLTPAPVHCVWSSSEFFNFNFCWQSSQGCAHPAPRQLSINVLWYNPLRTAVFFSNDLLRTDLKVIQTTIMSAHWLWLFVLSSTAGVLIYSFNSSQKWTQSQAWMTLDYIKVEPFELNDKIVSKLFFLKFTYMVILGRTDGGFYSVQMWLNDLQIHRMLPSTHL